jgi:hypothetical protein
MRHAISAVVVSLFAIVFLHGLVDACLRASGRLAEYPRHAARAFRLAGEIVEGSDASRTLAFWDRALALDPKVGISKRAAALRDKSRGS